MGYVLYRFCGLHKAEVMHVMTLDYTFERQLEMQRAEAIEDQPSLSFECTVTI